MRFKAKKKEQIISNNALVKITNGQYKNFYGIVRNSKRPISSSTTTRRIYYIYILPKTNNSITHINIPRSFLKHDFKVLSSTLPKKKITEKENESN